MKLSDLYNDTQRQIDALQKQIHNHVSDQLSVSHQLLKQQDRSKRLALLIINEGDREINGQDVTQFTNH